MPHERRQFALRLQEYLTLAKQVGLSGGGQVTAEFLVFGVSESLPNWLTSVPSWRLKSAVGACAAPLQHTSILYTVPMPDTVTDDYGRRRLRAFPPEATYHGWFRRSAPAEGEMR